MSGGSHRAGLVVFKKKKKGEKREKREKSRLHEQYLNYFFTAHIYPIMGRSQDPAENMHQYIPSWVGPRFRQKTYLHRPHLGWNRKIPNKTYSEPASLVVCYFLSTTYAETPCGSKNGKLKIHWYSAKWCDIIRKFLKVQLDTILDYLNCFDFASIQLWPGPDNFALN